MCQIVPCTKTLCSYRAISLPSAAGVSRSSSERIGRMVALERAMRHLERRHAVGLDLGRGLAERQGLGLGKEVGHQQIVMIAQRVERAGRSR